MKTKMCIRCRVTKPATAFKLDKKNRDGLQSYCQECVRIINRERYVSRKSRGGRHLGNTHGIRLHGEDLRVMAEDALTRWHFRVRAIGLERLVK